MFKNLFSLDVFLLVVNILLTISEDNIESNLRGLNLRFYWHVPAESCQNYDIYFDELLKKYGIIKNLYDKYNGEEIVELYAAGSVPYIINIDNAMLPIFGGIPEKIDLPMHLENLRNDLKRFLVKDFKGLGVLKYNEWWPIFRQNIDKKSIHQEYSMNVSKQFYPVLTREQAKIVAEMRFEFASKNIFLETIRRARRFYPHAKWGFLGYPRCYSDGKDYYDSDCDTEIMEDNNKLDWLWKLGVALYPSLQLKLTNNTREIVSYIESNMAEAERISKKNNPPLEIYFQLHLKYKNQPNKWLYFTDMDELFRLSLSNSVNGIILHADQEDLQSEEQCEDFEQHIKYSLTTAVSLISELIRKSNCC